MATDVLDLVDAHADAIVGLHLTVNRLIPIKSIQNGIQSFPIRIIRMNEMGLGNYITSIMCCIYMYDEISIENIVFFSPHFDCMQVKRH